MDKMLYTTNNVRSERFSQMQQQKINLFGIVVFAASSNISSVTQQQKSLRLQRPKKPDTDKGIGWVWFFVFCRCCSSSPISFLSFHFVSGGTKAGFSHMFSSKWFTPACTQHTHRIVHALNESKPKQDHLHRVSRSHLFHCFANASCILCFVCVCAYYPFQFSAHGYAISADIGTAMSILISSFHGVFSLSLSLQSPVNDAACSHFATAHFIGSIFIM